MRRDKGKFHGLDVTDMRIVSCGYRALAAAAFLLLLPACSLVSPPDRDRMPELRALLPAGPQIAEDGRAAFRQVFCGLLEERGTFQEPDTEEDHGAAPAETCDSYLARLSGEGAPREPAMSIAQPLDGWRLMLVPGFGADCFRDFVRIYQDARPRLAELGVPSEEPDLSGLASASFNAALIRDAVLRPTGSRPTGSRPTGSRRDRLIVIAYSKGIADMLVALATYPELADEIHAVVSIAGAVRGSLLAERAPHFISHLITGLPGSTCGLGDDSGLEDLSVSAREAWLATHALPGGVQYYSLVTLAQRPLVSNGLMPAYEYLYDESPFNDGQLLPRHQVIPGSVLLGFLWSDHLAAALPIAEDHPLLAELLLDRNRFPRQVLLEALVRFIAARNP